MDRGAPQSRNAAALALDAAGTAIREQVIHFVNADTIVIARDGVLQATRGRGKLQCVASEAPGLNAVNKTGREAIARADTVHNIGDLVDPAQKKLIPHMQARRPAVVIRALGLAHGYRNGLKVRVLLQHRVGERFVARGVELTRMDIGAGLHAQRVLNILLIGDRYIDVLEEGPHHSL